MGEEENSALCEGCVISSGNTTAVSGTEWSRFCESQSVCAVTQTLTH